jgi:hypothetical protein
MWPTTAKDVFRINRPQGSRHGLDLPADGSADGQAAEQKQSFRDISTLIGCCPDDKLEDF